MKGIVLFLFLVYVPQHNSALNVSEGVKSVQLPCLSSRLPEDTTVLWKRHGSNPSTVHQHQAHLNEPYLQNQHFSGRTSMSADALETGDLSLILKEPNHSDSGIYICYTYREEEGLIAFDVVELQIKVPQHSLTINVYEGAKSVELPCLSSWLLKDAIVVWSRFGFNPSTVHQHPDLKEPRFQNQHFSGRTSMSDYAQTFGYLHLSLKEPQLSDSGVYTCHVHNNEKEILRMVVRLQVTGRPTIPPEIYLLACFIMVGLGTAVAAFLWHNTITVSSVVVKEGVWCVKLPYKIMVHLPEDATVKWSRCAPESMMVHEYCKGNNHLVGQDEFYYNRTKMQKEPLKTRDLSLTLRDPCYRDSGPYICTVYKDREVLTQRVVRLQVNVPQEVVKVWDCAKYVTLPFKTRARLPADATVEWRCSKPENMVVHVFQNDQDQLATQDEYYQGHTKMNDYPLQSKDLSLTLHNSGYTDRGTYTCTVHRDGELVAKKVVVLRIKMSEADVEVDLPAKTVKLPWLIKANLPAEARVKWSRFDKHSTVHVYQNGQDMSEQQDNSYRDRTKMRENPLQTGDLSLTLINPCHGDSGAYLCTVLKDRDLIWDRLVRLKFKGYQLREYRRRSRWHREQAASLKQ